MEERLNLNHTGTAHDLKPPASSETPVNFTFVNLANDLESLTGRKITNQQQRYAIRSHVMRGVRQEELARGKRRIITRDPLDRSDSDKSQSSSSDSDSIQKRESSLPLTVAIKKEPRKPTFHTFMLDHKAVGSSATGFAEAPSNLTMSYTPAVHEFDPFRTLPCSSLAHKNLESILRYCFDVLLPLTFSVETKQRQGRLTRQGMVLQSKISSLPTFLGFMATAAAHRAIFQGHHKDLAPSADNHDDLITDRDYKMVKHEALVAVRRKVEQREPLDQSMVDACFGLIAAATVVGNFEEARMHLKGVVQVTSMVGVAEESMLWLPLSNVKVSVGLLSRPILDLPWIRCPMPPEVQQRITPSPGSRMGRLAREFRHLDELSKSLQALLLSSRDICNFCELNATDPRGLSTTENATLNRKATELEFDLLAYPYEANSFHSEDANKPQLPPVEAVVRLAALGFLSFSPHTILPRTGLGRALTYHQKQAFKEWLEETGTACGVSEMKAVTWALFIFTQNATQQPEEVFFSKHLAVFTRELRLLHWHDIETTMCGFLYIPSLQSSLWKSIWMASSRA